MRSLPLSLLATALAAGALSAQQPDEPRWLAIASSTESVVSLDRLTVNRMRDGSYAAWVEFRFRQTQSADEGTLQFDRTLYREQVDCVERRDRWLSITQYLGERRVRALNSDRRDGPWTFPSPGSIGEKIIEAVCEAGRRSAS